MSINKDKTKCLLFNKAKKYDFIPELCMSENTRLEVVKGMKLVGFQITSDLLKQIPNTLWEEHGNGCG